jgi:hypothetical protein
MPHVEIHPKVAIMPKIAFVLILSVLLASTVADAQQERAQTGTRAKAAVGFLDSLGVNTHVAQGYDPSHYVEPLRYLGIYNIRDSAKNLSGYFMLNEKAGARVDLICGKIEDTLVAARSLADHGALMAVEGPNEPNNFPITYQGEPGGGKNSWKPVAQMQMDLYRSVKNDPLLKKYPVFHVSEGGGETDNVGMQFLAIPEGAQTLFPAGTKYADYANPHNYVSGHGEHYDDNQAWQAADPTLNRHWDGLYVEYGKTWGHGYKGYANDILQTLPRVTTETGWDSVASPGGEKVQGTVLVNTYLAQFKRGWLYTFIYELGDGEGGDGNQGLYRKDWTPKPAAIYIHNLTTILADKVPATHPGSLNYTIANESSTVHDLLLQKSDGAFYLIVWGEMANGSQDILVDLGSPHPNVHVYDVTASTSPILSKTNISQIPLTLSDHAMVLEID